jgi:hypothetical protein
MSNYILGFFVGLCFAVFITMVSLQDYYEVHKVIVKEPQCNIEKPANTICKWEATWKPVQAIK